MKWKKIIVGITIWTLIMLITGIPIYLFVDHPRAGIWWGLLILILMVLDELRIKTKQK